MSQVIRCSPQPVGIDDVKDSALTLTDDAVRVDGQDDALHKCMHYFPQTVEDPAVVAHIKAQLVPNIVARQNVVALFYGHSGSGKTCLTEQVLPAVLEGLKTAIVSADEAYQEAINMGLDDVGSVRRAASASPGLQVTANKTLTSSPGLIPTDADTSAVTNDHKREPRKSIRSKSSVVEPLRSGTSKYSLMLARMPRDAAAVEMAQVDSRAIGSPRPLLPRLQNVSTEAVVTPSKDESASSPSRWRLALERAKTPISLTAGSLTTLGSKNGRGTGEHLFPQFDGLSRYSVEPVHALDKVLKDATKGLSISFWVQVDSTTEQQCLMHFFDPHEPNYCLSVQANTNDLGIEEAGCTLVTVRDSHGKRMETAFNTNMEDGRWHFVEIQILIGEKSIQMTTDNKLSKVKSSTSENVSSFHDQRPKTGIIGAFSEPAADGTRNDTALFKGSIMDLCFTEVKSGKKILGYTFRTPEHGLEDIAFATPNLDGPVEFVPRYFPQTSPSFDGFDRFINLGQIGDLGLMLVGTKIDICFRTSITNEKMCIMGVSDSVGKHPGFGIELNTNAQNQLQRYMVTFWLQDRHGYLARATCEMSNAFDDRWHTMSITIVDNEPYKFKVRLDGRHCECAVQTQGHPRDFGAFTQFVSLGGFHHKGDIWRHFRGAIKFASVSRVHDEVEEPLGSWPLNEGPGAVIAMDVTSHGLCGVYYLRTGCKGACFYPTDRMDGGESTEDNNAHKGSTRYTNNMVSMAFCEIRTEIDENGAVRESIVNLLTGKRSTELEVVPSSSFNPRCAPGDRRVYQTIHEDWYQRVVPNDYMSVFKGGLGRMEDSRSTHTVFVLRLGDASFTLVDLASLKKTPKAIFSPSQLTWSDAVCIYGNENKIHFSINTALSKLDKLLVKCGSRPQLFKRSVMQRESTKVISDNILVNVISFALLASKELSQLFQYHLISPRTKATEALHSLLLVNRMRAQDRVHAAMVLQKLFRWRKAFKRFAERLRLRKEGDTRKEKMILMRKQYPKDVLEKDKKIAMVIVCNEFEYDESMPKCWDSKFDDFSSLPRALESIGYKCELMLNPSRTNLLEGLLRKKQEQQSIDAMLLVHFVGVGGRGCYHQPPSMAMRLAWLQDTERTARLAVLEKQRKDLLEYYVDEQYEWGLLYDQYKSELEELERKNAKKKKNPKKDAQIQVITLPIHPTLDKAAVEESMKRWDSALAPPIKFPVDKAAEQQETADFICTGDSRAALSPDNTVTIREMKSILLSDQPKRGEHVIFGVDCTPFPSTQNMTTGFGALFASSGESVTVEYGEKQRLLLTYYLRRCVLGSAVECCRIGKHDAPPHVTMEIACKYLKSKLDPTEGRFGSRRLHVDWFGEYVGDVYIAHKIVLKKEDRRKAKNASQGKRSQVRIECVSDAPVRSETKLQIQQRLMQLLKSPTPIEVKKLVVDESFSVLLDKGDFNTLSQHQIAAEEVRADIARVVSGPMKCVPQKTSSGVCIRVTLMQPNNAATNSTSDGEVRDQKQQAQEYYEAQERRAADIDKRVFGPMMQLSGKTVGPFNALGCSVHFVAYACLSDEECGKLDRHCRLGLPFLNACRAASVRMLTEKETQEMEQQDRLIQMEETRRQTEAKLQLVRDAEARKKAEDEMTKMLQRKDVIVGKVQQLKGLGSVKPEEMDSLLSVPLADAISPVIELLALIITPMNAEPLMQADAVGKILSAAKRIDGAFSDSRCVVACLKLITTLAGAGSCASAPCSLLFCEVIGRAGPAASAAVLRAVPGAVEALHKGGVGFTPPHSLALFAASWALMDVEKKDQLSTMLLELSRNAEDLLHPDVIASFGEASVTAAAHHVTSLDADPTSALAALIQCIELRDVVDPFVAAIAVAVSRGANLRSTNDTTLHRIAAASWSAENAALYLSGLDKLDAPTLAQLEPLSAKLRGG